jgi:hypothetical protein
LQQNAHFHDRRYAYHWRVIGALVLARQEVHCQAHRDAHYHDAAHQDDHDEVGYLDSQAQVFLQVQPRRGVRNGTPPEPLLVTPRFLCTSTSTHTSRSTRTSTSRPCRCAAGSHFGELLGLLLQQQPLLIQQAALLVAQAQLLPAETGQLRHGGRRHR